MQTIKVLMLLLMLPRIVHAEGMHEEAIQPVFRYLLFSHTLMGDLQSNLSLEASGPPCESQPAQSMCYMHGARIY